MSLRAALFILITRCVCCWSFHPSPNSTVLVDWNSCLNAFDLASCWEENHTDGLNFDGREDKEGSRHLGKEQAMVENSDGRENKDYSRNLGKEQAMMEHSVAGEGKEDSRNLGKEKAMVENFDGREDKEGSRNLGKEQAMVEHSVVREMGDDVIVRFRTYKLASAHKEALAASMKEKGWEWIDRHNPASSFPTDFGLLRIDERAKEEVQKELKRLPFVKDLSPQSRFVRAILAETGDDNKSQSSDDGEGERKHGKRFTAFSWEDNPLWFNATLVGRSLLYQQSQVTSVIGALTLWEKGYTGARVKMAIFDTGVRADHPHFRNVKERTNWTNENTLNDNLGHGTFVAGVVASQDPECFGFAPDAEIYTFRVFTDAQISYTSWFLDAFNYAMATRMNILNLSIGGPDHLDQPFVEKVWEMTANNVIMVSAIGNDGPLYGTLNNPADQNDVIGVGGIDYNDHIASFSSRGMTTWEIPHGYGRIKPDVVAYGKDIIGSKISSGCKSLSGTSVASPVVAGAVCLLASVLPENIRWDILNPASMKQVLVEGAARLNGPSIFEQGAGRLDLLASYGILVNYKPRASIIPESLDFTDCPYFWPFCQQPLYAGAMPVIFNATILNGMGVVGYVEDAVWHPLDDTGNLLDLRITFPDVIWPWAGFLGLHIQIKEEGNDFKGIIEGNITLSVVSPPGKGEVKHRRSSCVFPVRVNVIPRPPRQRRILWDQFHNIRYPPGYIPRDSLDVRNDILDWHGDHPHTNFHGMFDMLRDAGYFLEILGSPLTCFDAMQYGTLLMVDLEDEYHKEEIEKLEHDVKIKGLGLIVFADWYHLETMVKMKFLDDNTRSWWTPVTGGANIPALNDLLRSFGIAFGGMILSGPYSIGGERGFYASGTNIARFPSGGFVHHFVFQDNTKSTPAPSILQRSVHSQVEAAILGTVDAGNGRIAVFGDSNCLDSSHMVINCYGMLQKLLKFTSENVRDPIIFSSKRKIKFPLIENDGHLPNRRDDVNFSIYSLVLGHELQCESDARFEVQQSRGYILKYSAVPSMRYQDMGTNAHDHRILSSLPLSGNFSGIAVVDRENSISKHKFSSEPISSDTEYIFTSSHDQSNKKTVVLNDDKKRNDWEMGTRTSLRKRTDKMELGLATTGWLNHDELDLQILFTLQWLIPVFLCAIGLFLVLSLWYMRQKRRRQARK